MNSNRAVFMAVLVVTFPILRQTCGAGGVVTEPTEQSLRAALVGGGIVTFAMDGTIVVTSPLVITNETQLDGAGHSIIISGSNAVRVLSVNPGVQFALLNLTIADGRANQGGGLYNDTGSVTISNCAFSGNVAGGGVGQTVYGGAIYSTGSLVLLGASFSGNVAGGTGASGTTSGTDAYGGAVYSTGTLAMSNTVFNGNVAGGGPGVYQGAGPGSGYGGAVFNQSGSLLVWTCAFTNNGAYGGSSPGPRAPRKRGAGQGGAIYNVNAPLSCWNTVLAQNGSGGAPAGGGGIYHGAGSLILSNTVVVNNSSGTDAYSIYYASSGLPGYGGGVFCGGTATVADCMFASNSVSGGAAVSDLSFARYDGGAAGGGGMYIAGGGTFSRCAFIANSASAGPGGRHQYTGGNGGNAYGAGLFTAGAAVNCTFVGNVGRGGFGNENGGVGGTAYGGGFCANGASAVTNCTFSANIAVAGASIQQLYGASRGGNIGIAGGTIYLVNTIMSAGSSNNASGSFIDLGHNLSSDASIALPATGSRTNIDPGLGPVGNYGGPTFTVPLGAGSPALDAGDNASAPATDQRGRPRPYNGASDIGAFESSPPYTLAGRFIGLNNSDTVEITLDALQTNLVSGDSYRFDGLAAGNHYLSATNPALVISPAPHTVTLGPDVFDANFTSYHPISIDVPPQSQAVFVGSNVTLTVTASGDYPAYQWRFNGTNLTGATTASYTIMGFQPSNAGPYVVIVSNVAGAVTSSPPAVLVVAAPPAFVTQPQSQTNFGGNTVIFQTAVTGTAPITFQWRKGTSPLSDDSRISGSSSSNLTIASLTLSDAGTYSLVASNAYGTATSSSATLTVYLSLAQSLGSALPWSVGGNRPWFTETSITHDGVAAAQSGAIADSQSSSLFANVTGPGTVTFWWKVSSEESADYLRFLMSGTAKVKISGEVDWEQKSFTVPAGTQLLEWRYSKDVDVSAGLDAGWLDEVRFENNLLDSLTWTTSAGFGFRLDGLTPGSYIIQASSNLVNWVPITTNTVSSNNPAVFVDSASRTLPLRFYRAQRQ